MEKQSIVTKIISDAEEKGLEILSKARDKAEKIVADEKDACEQKRQEQIKNLTERGEEIIRRREINARLDCNKITLSKKCEVLDEVFDTALEKLCAIAESEYIALVARLLEKHAERGDRVVLSSRCTFRDKISALPIVLERGLTVEKTGGAFKGGLVLVGNECDKNLTFEALIQSVKDEKQAEIASRLFG